MTVTDPPGSPPPHPQPDHDITPRAPRTVGGVVYLLVLAAVGVGLLVVTAGAWRAGLALIGGAMTVGGIARLLLPQHAAGMLGLRRRAVDVATLMTLGVALIVLAAVIPARPAG